MIHRYIVSGNNPHRHFIQISYEVLVNTDLIVLCQPLWRPGRYELQNYPKNNLRLTIFDESNQPVNYIKRGLNTWHVYTAGIKKIIVHYEYYAHQLDAGASWLDSEQLYINPCNCLMFVEGRLDEPCELMFNVPDYYKIATSMKKKADRLYQAENFHVLADSPVICSPTLFHELVKYKNTTIHFWFQGKFDVTGRDYKSDILQYTSYIDTMMNGLPMDEYHYMFQMLPYVFHHGVEHENSTVIALGSEVDFSSDKFYHEFMAICCHEFFHAWNVKRMRPSEMWPYNYMRENFSELGWIYEGITTYFGELFLYKSGVFGFDVYKKALELQIQKHLDNLGRLNYSVAESSYDTWLDGYVTGIPGRKVSIYTEGFLASLILDAWIQRKSEGKFTLIHFCNLLYEISYTRSRGYTENDIKQIIESFVNESSDWFFTQIIRGINYIEVYLEEALAFFGQKMILENSMALIGKSGLKIMETQVGKKIVAIWPDSPADKAGVDADTLIESIEMNEQDRTIYMSGYVNGKRVNYHLTDLKQEYWQVVQILNAT